MIHSTMLIDLRRSASAALAFYPVHHYYLWSLDDIMAFAFSARQAGNNFIIPTLMTIQYYILLYFTVSLNKRSLYVTELQPMLDIYLLLLEDVTGRTLFITLREPYQNVH